VKTDWNMIKKMMNAAINACESIEKTGYAEGDRDATINIGGQDARTFFSSICIAASVIFWL